MEYNQEIYDEGLEEVSFPAIITESNQNEVFQECLLQNFVSKTSRKLLKKIDENNDGILSEEIAAFISLFFHYKFVSSDFVSIINENRYEIIEDATCPELWLNNRYAGLYKHISTSDNFHEKKIIGIFDDEGICVETWKNVIWLHIFAAFDKNLKIDEKLLDRYSKYFVGEHKDRFIGRNEGDETYACECPYCGHEFERNQDYEIINDCQHVYSSDSIRDEIYELIKGIIGISNYRELCDLDLEEKLIDHLDYNILSCQEIEVMSDWFFVSFRAIKFENILEYLQDKVQDHLINLLGESRNSIIDFFIPKVFGDLNSIERVLKVWCLSHEIENAFMEDSKYFYDTKLRIDINYLESILMENESMDELINSGRFVSYWLMIYDS